MKKGQSNIYFIYYMSKINTNNKSTNDTNDTIDKLWVMGGASVLKDKFNNVVGYTCYCDKCKSKSSSGDGGIAFTTAEMLLEHRNMKAFNCPCGCGFHVCEERGSIMNHIASFHKEVLSKLEQEGLDPKKSWIIPDYSEHTYTLNKPKYMSKKPVPDFDNKSPIENAAEILDHLAKNDKKFGVIRMSHPKRVLASPSPTTSPTPNNSQNAKSWIVNKAATFPLSNVFTQQRTAAQTEKPVPKTNQKAWRIVPQNHFTPLNSIMNEQLNEEDENDDDDEEYVTPTHYAQEDMRKEKQCPFGAECSKKDRPFACAMNHDGLGDIIKRGTVLSEDILCSHERPGPGPGFKRCYNGHCTKIHLEGRVAFIEKKKKAYFENKQSNDNGSDTDESSASVDADEIKLNYSKKDALAIETTLREFGYTTLNPYEGDWVSAKNPKNRNSNKPASALNMQNVVNQLNAS